MYQVTVVLKSGVTYRNKDLVSVEVVNTLHGVIRDRGIIQIAPNEKTLVFFNTSELSTLTVVEK